MTGPGRNDGDARCGGSYGRRLIWRHCRNFHRTLRRVGVRCRIDCTAPEPVNCRIAGRSARPGRSPCRSWGSGRRRGFVVAKDSHSRSCRHHHDDLLDDRAHFRRRDDRRCDGP